MEWIHYLSGPVIGAIIGYFTNYIAVKMLFRPHREIRIFGIHVPFTPGLIPKRKNALAAAVGHAVADSLLTEADLGAVLTSEKVEDSVTGLCMEQIKNYMKSSEKVENVFANLISDDLYAKARQQLKDVLAEKIMSGVLEIQPGEVIAREGKKAVQEMLAGTMFAMFLHGDTLDSMAESVGVYAENYIRENGPGLIENELEKEIAALEEKRMYQIGEPLMQYEERVQEKIREIYRSCIGKVTVNIVSQFRIDEIIEEKIKAMDVQELEDLVMSVMKHELGMIVNLGALIGLILGVINIFL